MDEADSAGSRWRLPKIGAGWNLAISLIRRYSSEVRESLPLGLGDMHAVEKWLRAHEDYSVYSFDVFDTLLRRRVDPPEEVKLLVSRHISDRLTASGVFGDADEILAERNRVEGRLREDAKLKGMDAGACLDDIMAGTLTSIGAAAVLNWQEIVNYELDLEKAATEPMPGLRDVLNYLRSKQKRIVAVSETYLSCSQMASILEHHDLLHYIDRLYVSCDTGRSKLTGNLFGYVAENEGGQVVHIGDHYTFDYRIPKRLGMQALWFHSRDEHLRRRNLRKLSAAENRLAYVNAIIGSADRNNNMLYRIGHDVLGPALAVFVHCAAEQARRDGVKTIFFVARDGFVIKRIYQVLQDSGRIGQDAPKPKYMCLSRFPVRSASVNELTYRHISEAHAYMVREGRESITFSDILSSYGLESGLFPSIANRYQVDINRPITNLADDSKLHDLLLDREFQDIVRMQCDRARSLLREYLVSIGFVGGGKVALVDANSEGLTQSLMAQAFHDDTEYPAVYGYYFCLLNLGIRSTAGSPDLSATTGIVSDWRTMPITEQGAFVYLAMIIELFSHPNHGLTIGYKKVNGKVVPVFRRTLQESQYHLTSQGQEGILAYARAYAKCYPLHSYRCEDLLEDVRRNLKHWKGFPPHEHTEALKGLFVISDWPQESRHNLIPESRTDALPRWIKSPIKAVMRASSLLR